MTRTILTCVVALGLTLLPATALNHHPHGIWVMKQGDHGMQLEFGPKDTLKISHWHSADQSITILCTHSVTEENLVKVKITKLEEKGINVKDKLPIGLEFSFTWENKGDTAVLRDMKCEKGPKEWKAHLEGTYERKKQP